MSALQAQVSHHAHGGPGSVWLQPRTLRTMVADCPTPFEAAQRLRCVPEMLLEAALSGATIQVPTPHEVARQEIASAWLTVGNAMREAMRKVKLEHSAASR